MSELEDLITQQRVDDRDFQRPEKHTIHFHGLEDGADVFNTLDVPRFKDKGGRCTLHGYKYSFLSSDGEFRCRECRRLYDIEYRKAHPMTREQVIAVARKSKERYHSDAEFRERRKFYAAEWRRRMKEGSQ